MVIAESMYGSDRAGLVCGYVFQPGDPGRAIESDAAAGHLAARPRGGEFLWLHFSLTNAASVPWLQEHVSLPDSFYDSVKDGASTRVEVVDGALLAVINDLQFFAAEGSSAATVTLYVTERIIVSVRTTQLRAIDRLRASVKHGEPFRSPAELLAHLLRARMATLGRRDFSVTEARFEAYLADIAAEAKRARRLYDLLVVPGAEITQNHIRSRKNSHIIALDIKEFISADQPAEDILRAIRAQGALSIACHPHHRTTRRVEVGTCYLWDNRKRVVDLVDVWEAANRDDLFSVTSLKHYPYIANSDFHKPKHLHSWKTLVRSEKTWEAVAAALRSNVDVALTLYRNGSWAA